MFCPWGPCSAGIARNGHAEEDGTGKPAEGLCAVLRTGGWASLPHPTAARIPPGLSVTDILNVLVSPLNGFARLAASETAAAAMDLGLWDMQGARV